VKKTVVAVANRKPRSESGKSRPKTLKDSASLRRGARSSSNLRTIEERIQGLGAPVRRPGRSASAPPPFNRVAVLRENFGLTQVDFARLVALSVRSVAQLEAGGTVSAVTARRLTELERLAGALAAVINPATLGQWLTVPNPAFGGLKPLEVIERGEGDRLWVMAWHLESGVPS
jgi:transcriptional regulator with XRE-family HTH domain